MTRYVPFASLVLAPCVTGCTCDSSAPGRRGVRDMGVLDVDGGGLDTGTVPTDARMRVDIGRPIRRTWSYAHAVTR